MPFNLKAALADPRAWRRGILIDTAKGPKRLPDVIEGWQIRDFAACDNGWRQSIGLPVDATRPTYRYSFIERPRGHSKSSDAAIMTAWALAAAPTRRSGILVACDRDQGRLLRNAVASLVSVNPQLRPLLDVQNDRIVNPTTGSEALVLANDVPSSWGLLVDFCVCDEWSHAPTPGLWESIWSTLGKKESAYCQLQSNAGFSGSWQEDIYGTIRNDPEWYFSSLDGPQASWISKRTLEAQRRILPAVVFERTWLNRWTSGLDAAISEEQINRSIVLDGPVQSPGELFRREHTTILSCDLGLRKDASAICVVAIPHGGSGVRLVHTKIWKPRPPLEVDPADVEAEIVRCQKAYGLREVIYDNHQFAYVASRLRKMGVRTTEMQFVPAQLQSMAESLITLFVNGIVEIYPHPELVRQLRSLKIQESPNRGFRLIARRDSDGHSDLAVAMSMLAPQALALAQSKGGAGFTRNTVYSARVLPDARQFNLLARDQVKGGRKVFHSPGW